MTYYSHHVFFCVNQRAGGEACCNDHGAEGVRNYAKQRIKELGLGGRGKVRINSAGCLDRCEEGPVIVVYPEEVWYTYVDKSDIDEIIEEHIMKGRIVERLRL
jgi:(2Fe-2S) ferredoxin